jgi:ABC-type dipeptide/oligopeptide/nickel transport system ATPase component
VPNLIDLPSGCRFAPRCLTRIEENVELAMELHPQLRPIGEDHGVRCWLYHDPDGNLLTRPEATA